jgi:uncharacterized protein (DUF2225 family)
MCGKESEQQRITSSPGLGGYSDLDFRPRWAYMEYWIQRCHHCGYINTSLAQPCELSMDTLLSVYQEVEAGFNWREEFKKIEMRNPDISSDCPLTAWIENKPYTVEMLVEDNLAFQFAKLGGMFAKLDKNISAARQFLRVAWCFDDEGNNEQGATHWRKMSIKHIESAFRQLQLPVSETTQCIYADMLRRVGDFQSVLKLDENQLSDEVSVQLIKFQKELSEKGDSVAHKMSDNDDLLRAVKRKHENRSM